MLTMTENATTVIKDITGQLADAPEAGLRFSQATEPGTLAVAPVEAPLPDDERIEQNGARLYLDQSAVDELVDKELDAEVDESGQVAFSLNVQG